MAQIVDRIKPLPVEDPTCALKMVRALKRREVVVFDVDGNLGVGGEARTLQESLMLQFFGHDIHVRKGVAYLSHRTGAPIVPVISLWGRDGTPRLRFYDPIEAAAGESREDFTERALRSLYGLLETTLMERPDQWEMWPFFYKWITSPQKLAESTDLRPQLEALHASYRAALEENPRIPLRVDPQDAFVLRVRGKRILVDRRHFRFFTTTRESERLLRHLNRGTTLGGLLSALGRKVTPETVLTELARLRLLNLVQSPI